MKNILIILNFSAFRSFNTSILLLGTTASPVCAFCLSWLQQKLPDYNVKYLVLQIKTLILLKKLGTLTHYCRPHLISKYNLNLVWFAYASHSVQVIQLFCLIGIFIGDVAESNFFYILNWASRKSRKTVKLTAAPKFKRQATHYTNSLLYIRHLKKPYK